MFTQKNKLTLNKIILVTGLTVADGMAVVWILKIKGFKSVERIYRPDLLLAVSNLSINKDWRHYFYGSSIQVLDDLEQNLQNRGNKGHAHGQQQ